MRGLAPWGMWYQPSLQKEERAKQWEFYHIDNESIKLNESLNEASMKLNTEALMSYPVAKLCMYPDSWREDTRSFIFGNFLDLALCLSSFCVCVKKTNNKKTSYKYGFWVLWFVLEVRGIHQICSQSVKSESSLWNSWEGCDGILQEESHEEELVKSDLTLYAACEVQQWASEVVVTGENVPGTAVAAPGITRFDRTNIDSVWVLKSLANHLMSPWYQAFYSTFQTHFVGRYGCNQVLCSKHNN